MAFTGAQWDPETNFFHTQFRQYSTPQGRWMTPDPAGMAVTDPSNPQSWNRYAYVNNNPINATDPLGLENIPCIDSDEIDCGGGGGCDPFFGCAPPCDPLEDPDGCIEFGGNGPLPPPSGGGGGGSNPGPVPPTAARTGGVWLDNETLGLPGGLNVHPLSLGDLFGLTPGCEFGPCGDDSSTFAGGGADPTTQIKSLYENILEHLEKIAADPENPAVQHWRAEIASWAKQILKKLEKDLVT
jgi:RHS repeat-associated protein